jgi:hypothetical protein
MVLTTSLQCVDNFVDELRWEEADSEKRDKIRELKLNGEEWGRVNTFLGLLSVRLSKVTIHLSHSDSITARRQCAASFFI